MDAVSGPPNGACAQHLSRPLSG
jgi:hypothetical protein